MPLSLRPSRNRPSSQRPARTKRSLSAIRRQAARASEGQVGHVVVEHGRDRDHDAALARGREVGGLEADAVDGADLELGQRVHLGATEPGHAVRGDTTDARPQLTQRCQRVGGL